MKNEPLHNGDRPCDAHPTPERAQLLLKKNKEWVEKRFAHRAMVRWVYCFNSWCRLRSEHEGPCESFL